MLLCKVQVQNFRSIVDSHEFRTERLQALVGANNAGKSNILYALRAFLSAGAGGVTEDDFNDPGKTIVITATFDGLSDQERRALRRYLIGERLIIEKRLWIEEDDRTGKRKVNSEYHGYIAEPRDWWLSVEGVIRELETSRPRWQDVAEEHDILDYVQDTNGRVNKSSYAKGLERLLAERDDIEYEEPRLGETQALGYQASLLARLPKLYLLPAITDYADEIDRRSSSTVFRQLMGDLAERVIRLDPKYQQIEEALDSVRKLLNPGEGEGEERLEILGRIEHVLAQAIKGVMPSVQGVRLEVTLEETDQLFSRGVNLEVDDGIMTDVLAKGHGLQRCVVFGLLRTLIENEQGLFEDVSEQHPRRPIILAIEEPELYIHPQLQWLVYAVLKRFAESEDTSDQVLYTTHAPAFLDVAQYHRIGVVRKEGVALGTRIHQCELGVLGSQEERGGFQLANSFSIDKNRMFFAKESILVEGQEDEIAILATGRKLGLFAEFAEELEFSIVVCEGKEQMPKFQKVLNAFGLPYVVLLELDGKPASDRANAAVLQNLADNRNVNIDTRLEELCNHEGHFPRVFDAMVFFSNPDNINEDLEDLVRQLISPSP